MRRVKRDQGGRRWCGNASSRRGGTQDQEKKAENVVDAEFEEVKDDENKRQS